MKIILTILTTLILHNVVATEFTVKTYDNFEGKSMVFSPDYLKIEVGDEVTFVPQSKGHTTKSIYLPKSAKSWDSKTSTKITVKFTEPGIYLYDCRNHGVMGMMGMIEVGNSENKKEAVKFYSEHKKNVVMNKNRLDSYLLEK